jgi:hypothetical protein
MQTKAKNNLRNAELQAIATLKTLGFRENEPFMIGVANYALQVEIKEDCLLLWKTNCPTVRGGNWTIGHPIIGGFDHLRRIGESGKNIFIFPNKLVNGMSDRHATEFNTVFFEIDPPKGSNITEQLIANRERINAIQARGLRLSAQIYSGNKSDHNYFRLSCGVSSDVHLNLQRKAAIAFASDPAIVTISRKMRFPWVPRRVGDSIRECKTRLTDAVYTPSELEQWLDTLIKERYGVQPPEHISENRFKEYKRNYFAGLDAEEVCHTLNADEWEFEPKQDDIDLSDLPTEILHPIALKAVQTIPESIPGEGSYEEIYRRMCGGLKHIFGEEIAVQIAEQHSPLREASSVVRSLKAYNAASLFKVAREHGGFVWDKEDAKRLQDYFHEDILRLYDGFKGKALSIELAPFRKKFQLLGCPDLYWKEECNAIAAEINVSPVYGADANWWKDYEEKRVGLGGYRGEGEIKNAPEWIRQNQIIPWLNRLKEQGKRLFSYEQEVNNRQRITPGELVHHNGTGYIVEFTSEQERFRLVKDAPSMGYKWVVDISGTGTGKTHNLLRFGEKGSRVVLFLPSHRNPHVPELKDSFFEMPTRHLGMYRHSDNTIRRHPEKEGQLTIEDANCHKANEFLEAAITGRNLEIDSPCFTCQFQDTCGKDQQNRPAGSGFLRHRFHAFQQPRVRGHLSQFGGVPEALLKDRIAIVDEAFSQIQSFKTMTISIDDAFKKLRFLEALDPAKAHLIKPFLTHMEKLNNECKSPFGVSHDELFENAPNSDKCRWDAKAWAKGVLTAVVDGKINWDYANDTALAEDAGQSTPYEPLSDMIKIWCGDKGSISVKDGIVTITMPDSSHINMLKKFESRLLMDATPNLKLLAQSAGCQESEILVITRPMPDNSRLSITAIETPGTGSRQNLNESKQAQDRVMSLIEKIKVERDANARVIGLKNCPIPHDGYWGNHSRGDNSNSGVRTLIAYGLPYPNLEQSRAEWRAIAGTLDGFEAYYGHKVAAEIIQVAGRQRAHRYDGEFNLYMICSGLDPRFLKSLGCKVNVIHAAQIDPKLGTHSQYRRFQAAHMAREIYETQGVLTQSNLANVLGITQQAVQQITKSFAGGWKAFREKIQGSLISSHKDDLYFALDAQEFDDWQGFTPLEAVAIILPLLQSQDWDGFKDLLQVTCPQKINWVVAIALNLFALDDDPVEEKCLTAS